MVTLPELLQDMIRRDAADLYLTADAAPRFSVSGNFVEAHPDVLSADEVHKLIWGILTDAQKQEYEEELELNMSLTLGEEGRFRVNVFTQRGHVATVVRRIKTDIPTLEQLDLPPLLGKLMLQDRGMVLVTGATGSGKSTTLAAMINHRNETLGGHIVTIEDPIEFVHKHKKSLINQREVGMDTKSFHVAMKNTLRQAPKVIFIGEIRDTDTMEFALHASETGHLVLATLHSNNANQTLERIQNFFPHEYHSQLLLQLSLNLRAIVSQRLVKGVNGGRAAALEILLNTPYISELINKGDVGGVKSAMAAARAEGCQTFDQHLYELWCDKKITEEEAFRNADSANNLRLAMKGIGLATSG